MKKRLACFISVMMVSVMTLSACGSDGIIEFNPDAPADEKVSEAEEQEEKSDGSWAVYWYLCGSDLESEYGCATDDMNEMMSVKLPENVKFVIQTGGASTWQNEVISGKKIGRYEYSGEELTQIEEIKQANMGKSSTLSDFLSFCNENYPADHKIVLFWDHGGGSTMGVAQDENFDLDMLSLPEMRKAFEETCEVSAENPPYDMVAFDTCLMATVDVANIFKDVAKYLVASEETEPEIGWSYDGWIQALADDTTISLPELGKVICDTYYKACEERDYDDEATLSVTDLSKTDTLLAAYNKLGDEALVNVVSDESFAGKFSRAAKKTENYGGNTKNSGYSDMADMGDLVKHAKEILPNSSQEVLDAIKDAVVYQVKGKFKSHANGLSCYISYSNDKDKLKDYIKASGTEAFNHFYTYKVTDDLSQKGYEYVSALLGGEDFEIEEHFDISSLEDKALKIVDGSTAVLKIGKKNAEQLADVSYELLMALDDGETFVSLGAAGTPDDIDADWEKGIFKDNFRGMWGAIDGNLVFMELVVCNDDYTLYQVPIKLNGEETFLAVACDNASHEFAILGAHDELEHGVAPKSVTKLKAGDKVTPILFMMNKDDVQEFEMDTFKVTEDTTFAEEELGDGKYAILFEMTGTDGKYAMSDVEVFEVKNGVMEYL